MFTLGPCISFLLLWKELSQTCGVTQHILFISQAQLNSFLYWRSYKAAIRLSANLHSFHELGVPFWAHVVVDRIQFPVVIGLRTKDLISCCHQGPSVMFWRPPHFSVTWPFIAPLTTWQLTSSEPAREPLALIYWDRVLSMVRKLWECLCHYATTFAILYWLEASYRFSHIQGEGLYTDMVHWGLS